MTHTYFLNASFAILHSCIWLPQTQVQICSEQLITFLINKNYFPWCSLNIHTQKIFQIRVSELNNNYNLWHAAFPRVISRKSTKILFDLHLKYELYFSNTSQNSNLTEIRWAVFEMMHAEERNNRHDLPIMRSY